MMRNYVLSLLIFFCGASTFAQQYDKVWAIGTPITTMTFEQDTIIQTQLPDSSLLSFETIGSICDGNGNFLFCTNGLSVFNRFGNIMPNGDSLSYPSEYYNQVQPQGMPSNEGVVVLPKPGDSDQYYIFHYSPVDTLLTVGGYESLNLYYTVVDIAQDSGRGGVIAKNVPIIQNELLSYSRLAACKHANGRDWWIVKNAWYENIYYKFLLTPDGVQGPFVQQIGPVYSQNSEAGSYSAFNPDGSKYVSMTAVSYVVLMDFDRCTGLFSNPDSFYNNDSSDPLHHPASGGNSLAFSPSGRFLYIDNPTELNQYDLWSLHIHDSVRIETDTFEPYEMNLIQLAPNGKIYVSCYNGGPYKMHVINQPDSLGLACDFQLMGQPTATQSPVAIPYYPNFRLGALPGSACDTLTTGIATQPPAEVTKIEPNPAANEAMIVYPPGIGTDEVLIYDNLGRLVLTQANKDNTGTMILDLSSLTTGIYMVRFAADGKVLLNTKLVVAR